MDFVGLYEISKMADASFPQALVELKSGPVFRKSEVKEWLLDKNIIKHGPHNKKIKMKANTTRCYT